ncbi:MAG: zf-TFIIB domain-containing protein [Dictyoglomus sp.]
MKKSIKSLCQPSICPNDKSPIMLLKDPLIPKDIVIYYCEQCFGMWLPLDSLRKYKAYQRSRKESLTKKVEKIFLRSLKKRLIFF